MDDLKKSWTRLWTWTNLNKINYYLNFVVNLDDRPCFHYRVDRFWCSYAYTNWIKKRSNILMSKQRHIWIRNRIFSKEILRYMIYYIRQTIKEDFMFLNVELIDVKITVMFMLQKITTVNFSISASSWNILSAIKNLPHQAK